MFDIQTLFSVFIHVHTLYVLLCFGELFDELSWTFNMYVEELTSFETTFVFSPVILPMCLLFC